MLAADIAETVFEPRVGGHVYDRGVDGSECRWARVLAYEPPDRLLISWDIGPTWQIETDPPRASEVGVRFTAEDARRAVEDGCDVLFVGGGDGTQHVATRGDRDQSIRPPMEPGMVFRGYPQELGDDGSGQGQRVAGDQVCPALALAFAFHGIEEFFAKRLDPSP